MGYLIVGVVSFVAGGVAVWLYAKKALAAAKALAAGAKGITNAVNIAAGQVKKSL